MLNTAVLGTGLLALDLAERIQNSPRLRCGLVVGRTAHSKGLRQATDMGCLTTAGGIAALLESGRKFDIIFDVTNAFDHPKHWAQLADTGATLVDLTPTRGGKFIVPSVNGSEATEHQHIGLVTCGGQACIPVLHAISQHYRPRYVEMVATAASASVGRASRLNLDEYIETTQAAMLDFTGADTAKAMLNISPAVPAPPFRTAMTIVAPGLQPGPVRALVEGAETVMRTSIPGFHITSCTVVGETARVIAEVTATRGRMPVHAGNLEVISAAAIQTAEQHIAATIPTAKENGR
ncbi:acetylating acetaldehyde dehydrogenase [Streptomyces sp. ISL-98]|nr:acetylating acetaldehyde dehydrogenase [Streptomyces sp. ISL-98]